MIDSPLTTDPATYQVFQNTCGHVIQMKPLYLVQFFCIIGRYEYNDHVVNYTLQSYTIIIKLFLCNI